MASALHWLDYVLCSISLLISVIIGLVFSRTKTHPHSNAAEEFLLAGRNMNVIPASLSLFVSWMSAVSFLADPVEVYYQGAVYAYTSIGYCLALPIVGHIFATTYHKLQISSVYEYIAQRFGGPFRICSAVIYMITGIVFLGIALYAPAVALSQVTGIPEWISILIVGVVGTFYTTVGGMKAVVWADAIQSLLMFAGTLTLLICGLVTVGGFSNVWQAAYRGGRLNFDKLNPNPFSRSSVFLYIVGGFFRVLVPYTAGQSFVQRFFTVKTSREATLVAYLNIPMYAVSVMLFTMIGLVMYTYYENCDPLLDGRINRADQLIPLFMMEMFSFLPGISGLFLASLFAASLSSLSSIINSVATSIIRDFITPCYLHCKATSLSDTTVTLLAKIISFLFGAIVIAIAFSMLNLETMIFPMTLKITGIATGPVSAVFALGILVKSMDPWSAGIGAIISIAVCLWIAALAFLFPPNYESLQTNITACVMENQNMSNLFVTTERNVISTVLSNRVFSTSQTSTETTGDIGSFKWTDLSQWSPLLYNPLGYILTVILSMVIFFITASCKHVWRQSTKLRKSQSKQITLDKKQCSTEEIEMNKELL